MSEFKNTLAEINRLDILEEKISEFEGTAIETIQNGTHREKNMQKYVQNARGPWDNLEQANIPMTRVLHREKGDDNNNNKI